MDIRITHVISLDTALMAVLMSSVSGAAIAVASPAPKASAPTPVAEPAPNAVAVAVAPAAGDIAGAASDDGTLDSAGWPWSSELHASTKGITKEGLWRMKVGVSRPDPKPGFPKADGGIGTTTNGTASPAAAPVASAIAAPADEEDEFAAFTAAAAVQSGTVAAPVAREWTDADLGALCNQAAGRS